MHTLKRSYLLLLLALLGGCSTLGPPAPIEEAAAPTVSSEPPSAGDNETIAPVDTTPVDGVALAVEGLLRRGWAQVERGDWLAALSSAERAQRLNRFEPEVYLLIATAHYRLAQLQLAANIAGQGRSYAANGSEMAARLDALLALINKR